MSYCGRRLRSRGLVLLTALYGIGNGPARAQTVVLHDVSREAAAQDVERAVRIVETGIQETAKAAEGLAKRTDGPQQTLNGLIDQMAGLRGAEKGEPPAIKKPSVKQVDGRVPRTRLSEKTKNILIIVEGERAIDVDFAAINNASRPLLNTVIGEARARTKRRWEGTQVVNGGHHDFKYEFWVEGDSLIGKSFALVKKAGHDGDSAAQLEGSCEVRRRIENADPKTTTIQFAVYSDSFDLFRKIRALADKRQFEVGFEPVDPGEPIRIGAGGVSVQ